MALLPILTFPDPRLREVSQPVETFNKELETLISDMLETMKEASGIGLAAPQVGVLKRILVIDIVRPEDPEDEPQALTALEKKVPFPLVLVNPVIVKMDGQTVYEEGCLSVPGYYEEVKRAQLIEVQAQDVKGKKFHFSTDGLLSICIQHEMDHLEGKLFIDRLSFVKSNKIKTKIKKLGYPNKRKTEQTSQNEESERAASILGTKSSKKRSKVEV